MSVPKEKVEESNKEVQNEIEELEVDDVSLVPDEEESVLEPLHLSIEQQREDVRGRLAQFFIIGFFLVMILVVLLSVLTNKSPEVSVVDSIKESVLTVSGVLSGPLGFIIGFYFRKLDEE